MKVLFKNVKWDASKQEIKERGLKSTFVVEVQELDEIYDDEDKTEYLSDWLSDNYGFCHLGFDFELIED